MYDQAVEADSPAGHRSVGRVVAGSILAITIVLAFLIARRTPEYQAEARLSYVPAAVASPVAGSASLDAGSALSGAGSALPGAGSALAGRLLDDASLLQFITRYDLYPRQRLHASSSELAARFRSRLTLSQQESVVKLVFRDPDPGRTQSVVNAAAAELAAYKVVLSVPAAQPPPQPPVVARKPRVSRRVAPRKKKGHVARQMTGISVPPSGLSTPQSAATRASIAKVDRTLGLLARARMELQADLADVNTRIAAAGRAGTSAPPEDPSLAERVRLQQQIAAAKASLADLRSRYTENYPEVQHTEQRIGELQGLVARLPAASPRPRPAGVSIESLRSEQQLDEAALAKNAVAANEEQQRKAHLEQQEKASPVRAARAAAEEEESADSVDEPADPSPAAITQPVMTQVTVAPFRIVQAAGPARFLGVSKKAEWIALGVSTGLLLVLCFAPLVPVAPRVGPLHAEQPERVGSHVVYLGNAADAEDATRR